MSNPMFIAASFRIAEIWKQSKCPSVHEWIKKLGCIYTTEHSSVIKKKEILPFVTVWMDLENVVPSEISQLEKAKCHMISFIYGI